MEILISTHLFRTQRLGPAQLDLVQACGAAGVELFCARTSFDYHDRAQKLDLAAWFAQNRLPLHSLHSPIFADERDGRTGELPINIADNDPRRRVAALDEIERVLEFSEHAPFLYLIQHLGPWRTEWSLRYADHALSSLERIRLLAKQAGITLLVENIPNGLSQPQRLLAFLQASHLDDVGICFDSGHAHLPDHLFGGGGVTPTWELLGARVRSTHLHDNDGSQDLHLWPGDGSVPWPELLPRIPAAVPLVLEVGDLPGNAQLDLAQRLHRCFEQMAKWRNAS
ncbi:MAG: sugar phosphate isomerase/epimerase family protein [Terriglobales bacterium]